MDLALLSTPSLIEKLDDPNRWQRRMAQRLLADRRDHSAAALLRDRALGRHGQAALEALWALSAMGALEEAFARKLLHHADPYVRLWTARLLADDRHVEEATAGQLAELAERERNAEVLAQLACTAKRLPTAPGLAIVRGLLLNGRGHDDPYVPLLVWWAIEARCEADRDAVLALLESPIVWSSPLFTGHIVQRLMQRFSAAGRRNDLLTAARLLELAPSPNHRALLVRGFEEAFRGRSLAGLPDELAKALEEAGGLTEVLAIRQGQPQAIDRLLAALADQQVEPAKRLAHVQLLAEINAPRCVSVLLNLVRNERDEGLKMAALTALGGYNDEAIGATLLELLPDFTDDVRGVALAVLASRQSWALRLMTAVDSRQIAANSLSPDLVRKMTTFRDERLRILVEKHFGAVEGATTAQMRSEIERLAGVLKDRLGDPYQGKRLFAAQCGKCHVLFAQGGQVGPDLTPYKRDEIDALLLNVVNPSAEIREGFETQMVLTRDGRTVVGFVADRDSSVVVLRTAEGQTVTLPQEQIEETVSQRTSLMPEGLLKALSDDQVRHLFAYLRSAQPLPE
jgi:putative heme-binding domain-containing protein